MGINIVDLQWTAYLFLACLLSILTLMICLIRLARHYEEQKRAKRNLRSETSKKPVKSYRVPFWLTFLSYTWLINSLILLNPVLSMLSEDKRAPDPGPFGASPNLLIVTLGYELLFLLYRRFRREAPAHIDTSSVKWAINPP